MTEIEQLLVLVAVVTAISAVAHRLRLPAPVLLAVAGVALGALPFAPSVNVSPDAIQVLVLPPLLYAAALELPAREVREDARAIGTLAVGLVLISTVAVGLVADHAIPGLPLAGGLTLGALLAATDPVAITALSRSLALPRRLLTLVKSESLFNDATALVAFNITVAAAVAGTGLSLGPAVLEFCWVAGAGAAVGLAVGWVVVQVGRRLDDLLVENALSLVIPFLAYLPAEALGASGVTAVVFCGLFLSPRLSGTMSPATRLQVDAVWRMLVFLLEGAVFALIGLQLPTLVRGLGVPVVEVVGYSVLVLAVMVATRFVVVYAGVLAPRLVGRGLGLGGWARASVLAWAGCRGVVALAAALSLPITTSAGDPFPDRDILMVLTSFVILATLVVQGLTLAPLADRLGVRQDAAEAASERETARLAMVRAALAWLDPVADEEGVPEPVRERVRQALEAVAEGARAPEGDRATGPRSDPQAGVRLRLRLLTVQREEVVSLRDGGTIGDEVMRTVLAELDHAEESLAP